MMDAIFVRKQLYRESGGTGLSIAPTVWRARRAARTAAESPCQAGAEPVAAHGSARKRADLFGIVEHGACHEVEIDAGKRIDDADARRDAVLARDRQQAFGILHRGQTTGDDDAADVGIRRRVERVCGPDVTGT